MGKKEKFLSGTPPMPPPSGVKPDLGRSSGLSAYASLRIESDGLASIQKLQQLIPDKWKYIGPGAKNSIVEDIHITLLLQVTNSYDEALNGLTQVADRNCSPKFLICPPTITSCDRITENSVVCISSNVSSDDIISLRKDCFSSVESYVRYPGTGHVTYAYLKGEFADEIKKFLSDNTSGSPVESFSSHITLKMRSGKVHEIPFKK